MILTGPEVARFVGSRVGSIIYPPFTCMGFERGGEICGGVVFNCYTGHDVHWTAAGAMWPRSFLRAVGEYTFSQLKAQRATIVTRQPEVVKLALRLGAKVEGKLRNHFGPGDDATILGILKDEYRFGG